MSFGRKISNLLMQEENNGMEKAFLKERTSFGFICSCFGLLAERGNSSLL